MITLKLFFVLDMSFTRARSALERRIAALVRRPAKPVAIKPGRFFYFLAVGDGPYQPSIDFFEFATGKRKTVLKLGKQYWYGMALSPDQKSLPYSAIDNAGGNLMLVENFR